MRAGLQSSEDVCIELGCHWEELSAVVDTQISIKVGFDMDNVNSRDIMSIAWYGAKDI